MAGEPFAPLHALLALAILLLIATAFGRRASALILFLFAFAGVLLPATCSTARSTPGTGIVGLGLGGLAASSLGRRTAPALVAVLGTLVGHRPLLPLISQSGAAIAPPGAPAKEREQRRRIFRPHQRLTDRENRGRPKHAGARRPKRRACRSR